MHKLKSYIIGNFSKIFFSIFLPLLSVASIILLVKIATVTAVVKLDVLDMTRLYFYFMPQILFFTIPISFFVAGVLTINRFSQENELVVIFALGIKPRQIVRIMLAPSIFLSIILLTTSLVIIPHAEQLYYNYLNFKRTTAKFNISASEFGQKFGEWMLFIESENFNQTYKNVALFKPQSNDKEFFAVADKAHFSNTDKHLKFKLTNGKTFVYDHENLTQINFQKMQINDTSILEKLSYVGSWAYWQGIAGDAYKRDIFTLSVMLSLLPILSVFFFLALGTVNSRHTKGYTYLGIFSALLGYIAMFSLLSGSYGLYAIPISIFTWLALTYGYYRYKITRRY